MYPKRREARSSNNKLNSCIARFVIEMNFSAIKVNNTKIKVTKKIAETTFGGT